MGVTYQFSYDKLWHKLIDLKLKKKDLQKQANLSPSVIAKMGRGESVNLETLAKICLVLHCGLSDIVDIILKEG
ncbi:helix-turn-helix domain-containing protein [Massiliimalia timonensis]|uniref:helix-turn-helix domain-containing protein n=1 Tax=Massiliimalia timonensis TaxID=1987501 RepID=UPI00189F00AF|nr:helix-turn-helix transcriptional regulator [Massiliimalia timonensis]